MVLVRLETESDAFGSEAKSLIPARDAVRLLSSGKLGSKLVALAQTAAAVHRARSAEMAITEAKQ